MPLPARGARHGQTRSAISVRCRKSQRLSQPPGDPGNRTAHRRQIRIRPDPARRHLQGHQQQVAGRDACRRKEQARASRHRNRTFPQALRRQALHLEPAFSGQHAEPDARRGGRADGRRVREICRCRIPSHVGRAEEDGRSGSGDEGARRVGHRCRKTVRARTGCRREGKADREHAIRGRTRRLRLANLLCWRGNVFRQGAIARRRGNGDDVRRTGRRLTVQKRNATVAVIGAGDYIGAEIVKKFAAEGFTVFAGRRNGDKLAPLVKEVEDAGGEIVARSLDARKEDETNAFLQAADAHAPLEVTIFNVGANVNFPILETTDRVFRKVWEMACWAGFLAGRESARLMLARGGGNIFFTGATASLRGGSGFAAFASAKFGLRAVAQAMARELGPKNIHVAHLIIDSGVDTAWVRERREQMWGKEALENPDLLMPPASVAASYWQLYQQPRSAWTFELEIRPYGEKW